MLSSSPCVGVALPRPLQWRESVEQNDCTGISREAGVHLFLFVFSNGYRIIKCIKSRRCSYAMNVNRYVGPRVWRDRSLAVLEHSSSIRSIALDCTCRLLVDSLSPPFRCCGAHVHFETHFLKHSIISCFYPLNSSHLSTFILTS